MLDKKFWNQEHVKGKDWIGNSSFKKIIEYHKLDVENYRNKKILDIGVGSGDFLKNIKKYTNNLYASDISNIALKKVENYAETFLTDDLKKIPKVDLAICHLVFQHCLDEEVERIINEIQLADNGIFSFQYAYLRNNDNFINSKGQILNHTHFFRNPKKMKNIIDNSNKYIIDKSLIYKHPEFNWEILKVKNK